MYKEEYEILQQIDKDISLITINNLINKLDRTLLYGYTCERDTWHVYIEDNKIYKVIYNSNKEPEEHEVLNDFEYVPDKRLYPECCDYEFCRLLKERGAHLPFTTWQDRPEKKIYWGKTL